MPTAADQFLGAAHAAGPLTHIWDNAPTRLVSIVVCLVALAGLIAALTPLAAALRSLARFARRLLRRRGGESARLAEQRRRFAGHVAGTLVNLSVREDWRDERFAELEAIVEVEGRERGTRWLRLGAARRQERPLSKELGRVKESLVILTGEPGSGKSVAMRHLAERMALLAQKHPGDAVIPLYVNLKGFRPGERGINAEAVRDYIFTSLTGHRDREVNEFLEKEFQRGMQEGWWLFLLDSFDEIPEVLSAVENGGTVTEYVLAIKDFVSGMRRSQAIVASRQYNGPNVLPVPRFRIVELTAKRQADLVRRAGLTPPQRATVQAGLAVAEPQMQADARNPMFLSLVCEYVRAQGDFPSSSHETYDDYAKRRLSRDADRIRQRHGMEYNEVRRIAEGIAFVMTAANGLGLSAAYDDLRSALSAGGVTGPEFDAVLAALEETKLGQVADAPDGSRVPHFTFTHRRFQEYFATCAVIRTAGQVSDRELLTNARWRETAVTLLQIQPKEAAESLLREAARLLRPMVRKATSSDPSLPGAIGFSWPPGCLHLLQLLDAGLGHAPDTIRADIREASGRLLRAVWENGQRYDRKWAVSVALVADRETTIWLVREAFQSGSVYLGGTAYTVVSRMADPPESLYHGIRQTLVAKAAAGQLRRERVPLAVQISRLPDPEPLLRVLRLLLAAQVIDLILGAVIVAGVARWRPELLPAYAVLLLALIACLPRNRRSPGSDSTPEQRNPWRRAVFTAGSVPIALWFYNYSHMIFFSSLHLQLWRPPPVLLGVVAYCWIWELSVDFSCTAGFGLRIYEWLLLPLLILVMVFLSLFAAVADFLRSEHEIKIPNAATIRKLLARLSPWLWPLFFTAAGLALLGLLANVLDSIGRALWRHLLQPEWDRVPHAVRYDLSTFWWLAPAAFFAAVAVVAAWRRLSQEGAVLREFRERGTVIDGQDLLQALSRVTMQWAARTIITQACNADLVNSANVSRILFDLTRLKEGRSADEMAVGPDVEQWLLSGKRRVSVIGAAAQEAHDSIAQAVERAELARQAQPARRKYARPATGT